jgi:hypothetical protein
MTFFLRILAILFAAGLSASTAAASGPTMAVDEIEPGMTGYGLTVFKGADPERFGVEIIDIMRNALHPQGHMILVRCSGGPLADTGIIAGMSGSPIYIDERLIGALAYGWSFSKFPIGGVTPIHEMLTTLDRGLAEVPMSSGAAFSPLGGPMDLSAFHRRLKNYLVREYDGPGYDDLTGDHFASLADNQISIPAYGGTGASGYTADKLAPIPTPLVLAGAHGTAFERMDRFAGAANFIPLRAGQSASARKSGIKLVPGGAVAVQLISGDMDANAVGTVTWVDGDRVLAFGHPMFQAGAVNFPMATAYIDAVIPSLLSSSKLGSSVELVGSIRQDRAAAIAGLVGGDSDQVGLTVITDMGGEIKKQYDYNLIRPSLITPGLIESALMTSLAAAEKLVGDYTIQVQIMVEMDSREPFVFRD